MINTDAINGYMQMFSNFISSPALMFIGITIFFAIVIFVKFMPFFENMGSK